MRRVVSRALKVHVFYLLLLFSLFVQYGISYADDRVILKGTLVDIDGNVYNTLKIGRQVWMFDNLNVSRYCNGDVVNNVSDYDEWTSTTSGAWSYYDNNKYYSKPYGKLYNWHAVNDPRGLAPKGWHIPSYKEWRQLIDILGGDMVAGTLIKFYSRMGRLSSGETVDSKFDDFFSGSRYLGGAFLFKKYNAYYWTSSKKNDNTSWYINLNSYDSKVYVDYNFNHNGMSVRCVKDSD